MTRRVFTTEEKRRRGTAGQGHCRRPCSSDGSQANGLATPPVHAPSPPDRRQLVFGDGATETASAARYRINGRARFGGTVASQSGTRCATTGQPTANAAAVSWLRADGTLMRDCSPCAHDGESGACTRRRRAEGRAVAPGGTAPTSDAVKPPTLGTTV